MSDPDAATTAHNHADCATFLDIEDCPATWYQKGRDDERQRIRARAIVQALRMEASNEFDYLPIAAGTLRDFADLLDGDGDEG